MGQAAEMILDGLVCQGCNEFIHENLDDPPGHPVWCSNVCEEEWG